MPNAHRQARRFLTRAILAVTLFGVVTNVTVAWCCAIVIDVEEQATPVGAAKTSERETWRVLLWTRVGATRVLSQRFFVTQDWSSKTLPSALIPAWVDFDRATPEWEARTLPVESRLGDARGWPLLSLWSRTEKARSLHKAVHGGIVILGRILPLRPVWPGFFVDSALYAFALALPLVRFTARRFWRLRQYRCVKCGYPIGASRYCTDCGHILDRQARLQIPAA